MPAWNDRARGLCSRRGSCRVDRTVKIGAMDRPGGPRLHGTGAHGYPRPPEVLGRMADRHGPCLAATTGRAAQEPPVVDGRPGIPGAELAAPTTGPILGDDVRPIDLNTALRLAGVQNPEILVARSRVLEAVALRQFAAVQILPSLNGGMNYDIHTGNLQQSNGNILAVNRAALYVGAGTNAIAAGTVNIPGVVLAGNVAQGIFLYLGARQEVRQREFDRRGHAQSGVPAGRAGLLRAGAGRGPAAPSAIEVRESAEEVARITAVYAADRPGPRGRRRPGRDLPGPPTRRGPSGRGGRPRSLVRLCRLLNLDPSIRLHPTDAWVVPQPIVPEPMPLPELIALALMRRPELGAQAGRRPPGAAGPGRGEGAAVLADVPVGFSAGTFRRRQQPGQPDLRQLRRRGATWTWSPTGRSRTSAWATSPLIRAARARVRRQPVPGAGRAGPRPRRGRHGARPVARPVSPRSASWRGPCDPAARGSGSTWSGSSRPCRPRTAGSVRPIEVLDSLRLLADSMTDYLDAIVDYNQAEFELYVALGQPPADALAHPVAPAPAGPPPLVPTRAARRLGAAPSAAPGRSGRRSSAPGRRPCDRRRQDVVQMASAGRGEADARRSPARPGALSRGGPDALGRAATSSPPFRTRRGGLERRIADHVAERTWMRSRGRRRRPGRRTADAAHRSAVARSSSGVVTTEPTDPHRRLDADVAVVTIEPRRFATPVRRRTPARVRADRAAAPGDPVAVGHVADRPVDRPSAGRRGEPDDRRGAGADRRGGRRATSWRSVELLPNLNAGMNYHGHTGPLQRSSGEILDVSRQSLYIGGGARALAAETVGVPAVNIVSQLADALYDPLAARQRVDQVAVRGRRHRQRDAPRGRRPIPRPARGAARLEARRQTAEEAAQVVAATAEYAAVGEGLESDARRAETEWQTPAGRGDPAPRRTSPSPRPAWPAGCTSTPRSASSPIGDPLALFELTDLDTPLCEGLVAEAVRRRPGGGRAAAGDRRGRDPDPAGDRPAAAADALGRPQRGGLRRRQQPRAAAARRLPRPDRRRRPRLLDAPEPRARQHRRRSAAGAASSARRSPSGRVAINAVREEVASALADAKAERDRLAIAREELETAERGFRRDFQLIRAGDRPADRAARQPRPARQGPRGGDRRGGLLQPGPVPPVRRPRLAAAAGSSRPRRRRPIPATPSAHAGPHRPPAAAPDAVEGRPAPSERPRSASIPGARDRPARRTRSRAEQVDTAADPPSRREVDAPRRGPRGGGRRRPSSSSGPRSAPGDRSGATGDPAEALGTASKRWPRRIVGPSRRRSPSRRTSPRGRRRDGRSRPRPSRSRPRPEPDVPGADHEAEASPTTDPRTAGGEAGPGRGWLGAIAAAAGLVPAPGAIDRVALAIEARNLAHRRPSTVIGFDARPAAGSTLRPRLVRASDRRADRCRPAPGPLMCPDRHERAIAYAKGPTAGGAGPRRGRRRRHRRRLHRDGLPAGRRQRRWHGRPGRPRRLRRPLQHPGRRARLPRLGRRQPQRAGRPGGRPVHPSEPDAADAEGPAVDQRQPGPADLIEFPTVTNDPNGITRQRDVTVVGHTTPGSIVFLDRAGGRRFQVRGAGHPDRRRGDTSPSRSTSTRP